MPIILVYEKLKDLIMVTNFHLCYSSVASSRRHQSTMPSSLSASASGTPSDSPQRSRQAPEGCTNSELCQTRIVLVCIKFVCAVNFHLVMHFGI